MSWGLNEMAAILQATISNVRLEIEWKLLHFNKNFIDICSLASDWQWFSIGSGKGLVPSRQQALPDVILTQFYNAIWRY